MRLRRERLAVALEHKVYVYNFADLKLQHATETAANPSGLLALSPGPGAAVLACPGLHRGGVRLEWYDSGAADGAAGGRRTRFVAAHDGALAALALSPDGARLATASDKGTLLRVWDTATGAPLAELRRGADRALIYSIAFSPPPPSPAAAGAAAGGAASQPAEAWLAASSDKGTVHVWRLPPPGPVDAATAAAAAAAQPQQPPGDGGGSGGKLGFMVRLVYARAPLRLVCVLTFPSPNAIAEGAASQVFLLGLVARAVPIAAWRWRPRRQRRLRLRLLRARPRRLCRRPRAALRGRLWRRAAHAARCRHGRHIPPVRRAPFIYFCRPRQLTSSRLRCFAALPSTPLRPASAPVLSSRASSTPRASLKPATPQPPRWTRCRSRHLPRPPQPPQTHDPMKRQLKK